MIFSGSKRHKQIKSSRVLGVGYNVGDLPLCTVIQVHSDSRPQMSKRPNLILCQLPDPAENGSDRINLSEIKKLSIPA